ncbi:Integrin-like repeats domain fused to lysozyme, LYCV glycosyl hydrolase [Minicystis rosea]|nr:Integrin-like repeats domain fused to lysozyme, LYCV glycosyl hydrolase [Minicystis rosea]
MNLRALVSVLALPLLASSVGCVVASDAEENVGDRDDEVKVCPSATVEGIDVSSWQGNIDWSAVRGSGREFAFIRVSDGANYFDSKFDKNWSEARAVGMARGVYQFFRPGQDPIAQANLVLQHLGSDLGELPIVVDVEVSDGVGPATLNARLGQWISRIKQATGRTPMIYTSPGLWPSLSGSSQFADVKLWVAHWGASCPTLPTPWSNFSVWQYADNGHVPGISGNVDLDRFNGTLADLKAHATSSAPRGDLFGVKMSGTGTGGTEVHVLSRDSGYKQFTVHTGTALASVKPTSFAFGLGDVNHDGTRDLFAIQMNGTGTKSTEVHVLDGAASYDKWLVHTGTPLEQTNSDQWKFAVADHDGDGVADLYAFKLKGTGTKSTEVHILSGLPTSRNGSSTPGLRWRSGARRIRRSTSPTTTVMGAMTSSSCP